MDETFILPAKLEDFKPCALYIDELGMLDFYFEDAIAVEDSSKEYNNIIPLVNWDGTKVVGFKIYPKEIRQILQERLDDGN